MSQPRRCAALRCNKAGQSLREGGREHSSAWHERSGAHNCRRPSHSTRTVPTKGGCEGYKPPKICAPAHANMDTPHGHEVLADPAGALAQGEPEDACTCRNWLGTKKRTARERARSTCAAVRYWSGATQLGLRPLVHRPEANLGTPARWRHTSPLVHRPEASLGTPARWRHVSPLVHWPEADLGTPARWRHMSPLVHRPEANLGTPARRRHSKAGQKVGLPPAPAM